MRQDSERKGTVTRVRPQYDPSALAYAACSSAHTSPHRSWNRWR